MDTQREWDLIRRCRAGSAAAFEPLVRGHEAGALSLAEALLGDADEAADAVQDAFVKAFRSLGRLAEGSAFGPWFRTILRNHCRDLLRSPRRRTAALTEAELGAAGWSEPTGTVRLEREQLASAVRSALAGLTPEHREVLVLKEMEGLSYTEIAATLGLPSGTVGSRLHQARAALRRVLAERGVTLEEVR